jgi:ribonuclease HI
MSTESSIYLGFTDGVQSSYTNLDFVAWVVYSPEGQLVSSGGICLGPSMNNVAEYSIVIEILRDVISHGIRSLEVLLDSQLVVCQLNNSYHVRDPTLLRRFLRV